ncbi:MAG: hypothetical protein ABI836_10450 [Gemmatimonadota bacterium]
MPGLLLGFLLAFISLAPLAAQEHEHGGTEGLGRVVFPVSCNPVARQRFEPAMAMLHSFWWEEAPHAFQAVLEADSSCAMAHWGLALNAWGNPFTGGPIGDNLRTGAAEAERAAALGAPTVREHGFIAAARALYRDYANVSSPVRLRAYSDTLARVYRDVPDDPEVAIYYALSLIATASPTDTMLTRQKQAAAILNPLYTRFPDHPGLAHYIIHANDSPQLASLGVDAARRYAGIAPDAPHAQHMPSHIFIRLGLWAETIASNRRAYQAGVDYGTSQGLTGVLYETLHALDYLVYGLLQTGQDSAARRMAAEGLAIPDVLGPSPLTRGYNRTAMEARLALETADWRAAARLPVRDTTIPVAEMLSRFTRGIGAARSGDVAQATAEMNALERIEEGFSSRNDSYWARMTGIKRQAVHAWILLSSGDTTGAFVEAKTAADQEDVTGKHPITPGELLPARELEADLHLALGHFPAARAAYLAVLERQRGRARSLFGAARSAELAGDKATAAVEYRAYLEQMSTADGERAEISIARAGAR